MRFTCAFLQLFICCAILAPAQTNTRGRLEGSLADPSGAPIPNATLTLELEDSSTAFQTTSDARGEYRFASLPIGFYHLKVTAPGFATLEIKELQVSIGQTVVQRLGLSLATAVEKMEVVERAEILQASSPNQSTALGYERMEHSAAPGRNYLSFVLSAPGMTPAPGSTTGRSPAGTWSVANDSGFSFAGMRSRNNNVSIDGTDNRDETTGAIRVALPLEMIQELRIAGTTVSADFGGAAGGQVNVVTRSGTNTWHGHGEFMWMHEAFLARNPEFGIAGRPLKRRYQPGASGGGPLTKDRTFIAFAAEGLREDCEEWSETPNGFVRLPGLSFLRPGLFRALEGDQQYSVKLNHIINPRHTITARGAYSWGRVRNGVQGIENYADFSSRGSSTTRDYTFVPSLTSVFGARLVNQIVVQLARRSVDITPNSRTPQIEIPGVATFGQGYRLDQQRTEDHYEVTNSASLAVGRHYLSLGASVHHVAFDGRLANRFAGISLFPSLDAYLRQQPDLVIQALGDPRTNFGTTPISAWINDRWQFRRGLTLEAGLRYDRQAMPGSIAASNLNFAPRFGLAWNPHSRLVFRFGSGLFFDRYPLAWLNDAIQKDGRRASELYNGARARYETSRDFPSTYSAKVTTGFEAKLNADTTLSAEYSFVRGLRLPRTRNLSPALFLLEQTARSQYQGVTVTLNRRMTQEFGYLISYSGGRTRDDGSDFDEQPLDPRNIALDRALSRQHQAHRVSASALLEVPLEKFGERWEHIHFVPTFTFGSGRPINTLLPFDAYRTLAYPITARPLGVARNTVLSPSNASLDARLFKEFHFDERHARFQIGVEGYNLFNRTNPIRFNQYTGPGFAQPLEFSAARQMQLFLHYEF